MHTCIHPSTHIDIDSEINKNKFIFIHDFFLQQHFLASEQPVLYTDFIYVFNYKKIMDNILYTFFTATLSGFGTINIIHKLYICFYFTDK